MIITFGVIIGLETILLVFWAIKCISMRSAIAQHASQLQQLSESHARELQSRMDAGNQLLRQQSESAAVAAQKQEEAMQLALSKQQSAFEEAKQILATQYERMLRQQKEDAARDAKVQSESYERTLREKNDLFAATAAKAEKTSEEMKVGYEKRLVQQKEDFDKAYSALEERWQKELSALREEFKNSAGKMLEERTVKLDESNQRQMKVLLEPFRDRIKELQEELTTSQKERTSLKTEVQQHLMAVRQNAEKMVSETDKLTSALKGSNKMQGNWGELQLEHALESCGLTRDCNFMMQHAIKDSTGKAFKDDEHNDLIPDATVLLPNRRRVFIDSKMSMTAYMRYVGAQDDNARKEALAAHMDSVVKHIKSLSRKNYPHAGNLAIPNSSFENTIMFMGNEGALMLALNTDPGLWEKAFLNDRVILVSRMSLYPLLWLIQKTWQVERQSKKQEEILKNTGLLIHRLDSFIKEYEGIGDRINALQDIYTRSLSSLRDNSQSVLKTGKRVAAAIGKETKYMDLIVGNDGDAMEYAQAEQPLPEAQKPSAALPEGCAETNSDDDNLNP